MLINNSSRRSYPWEVSGPFSEAKRTRRVGRVVAWGSRARCLTWTAEVASRLDDQSGNPHHQPLTPGRRSLWNNPDSAFFDEPPTAVQPVPSASTESHSVLAGE